MRLFQPTQELTGCDDRDMLVGPQVQQVPVSADNQVAVAGNGCLEELVVTGVGLNNAQVLQGARKTALRNT
jgi:hypothetical protein